MAVKLSKHMEMNNHTIELIDNRQSQYDFIYNLDPVEFETLKTYIKNNLANGFIIPFKSLTGSSIFCDKKSDRNLKLCINY